LGRGEKRKIQIYGRKKRFGGVVENQKQTIHYRLNPEKINRTRNFWKTSTFVILNKALIHSIAARNGFFGKA
jgi:hypothetical protein